MKEAMKLGDKDQGWNFEASMNNEEKRIQNGEEKKNILLHSLYPFEINASKFQSWSSSPHLIAFFIQILEFSS